jgi:hypothetical protein
MKYDIIKFVYPCLGLIGGFYTAFSTSPVAVKLRDFGNLIIAGILFVIIAVVFHSSVQGYFDSTALIDFLTLKKIGVSGPRKILAFGYFLIFWALPVLIIRKKQGGLTSGSTADRD